MNMLGMPNNPKFGPWFDVEKILDYPDGAVIADISNIDAFYTTAFNSQRHEDVAKGLGNLSLIPINADALMGIAQAHTMLHLLLAEHGVNFIPFITNMGVGPMNIPNPNFQAIPNIHVYKQSGEGLSHRGRGVSIIDGTDRITNLAPSKALIQPFVLPPVDETGERYVRDIRVIMVGGQAVTGITRKARKPLTPEMVRGEIKPTDEHYPSAHHKGTFEELSVEIWSKVKAAAEQVAVVLNRDIARFKQQYSQASIFGYGSIDFLIDDNNAVYPVDFDIFPSVHEQLARPTAMALAEYLIKMAKLNGGERLISVVIQQHNKIFIELVRALYQSSYPKDKIVVQDILY